ncbi:rRNA maturation RNase YbeY [Campylobacter novaezeelandiae]|uniref:Endoribonuclease YbeY n=1 Tax=Campylobacter novaezeelandiae TaxID=2267891 RepID=A0A4V2JQN0_9BACT|nr:rRNA maturation RNase YbeY [Campylobacter novaezeelandiae]MBK1963817.1 rRNA maturation RNase YbeY [Campylobacter novaezeelandiae]MBK1992746.1 rRNA maturation RNase YbeY [Campylobacter novaezeelandiae]QWU79451.1 rRNA maturation RNase [Campylobacter novaezeelandiae]TBR78163.1 rRNA maturation RNase YbeY [Campylobacter novaezeelandiae]TBR79247.1 rRNA maturation RNase YbeY [Campylobacter novaezeelandiae]
MIICDENVDFLEKIAQKISSKDVELIFLNNEQMRNLNLEQRGIDKSTDVLSFPLVDIAKNLPLGSIVINTELAKEKAKEFNHTYEEEISLLFIHAMLHLIGFDHEIDKGEMREKEKELINFFKLPKSLIVRNDG